MNYRIRQRGATLVISLILMAALTLFVISMLNTSNSNLRIVGNMQAHRLLEATAQKAIEDRITTMTFFQDAIDSAGIWVAGRTSLSFVQDGYSVTVYRPSCDFYAPEEGNSALNPLVPEETVWTVRATASDPVSGGLADVSQGVRMRLLAGNCPA
jgi:hypothetical protein